MLMPSIFGENVFNGFFDDFGTIWPERRSGARAGMPAIMKTDVKETETGYELDIDLPGYNKEDVKAELKDGYLTISAETKTDTEKKDEAGKYIRRERYFGNCSRRFFVGEEIEPEDIKARFENGILNVCIPKKEAKEKIEENRFVTIEG
ncbi:MAG: Hsp20/alpha crystallin family protein [Lachnospiraceae bacterium]|nr:Hsp20/alpha crystallin family protein [Lachnospiraceae bacterium]